MNISIFLSGFLLLYLTIATEGAEKLSNELTRIRPTRRSGSQMDVAYSNPRPRYASRNGGSRRAQSRLKLRRTRNRLRNRGSNKQHSNRNDFQNGYQAESAYSNPHPGFVESRLGHPIVYGHANEIGGDMMNRLPSRAHGLSGFGPPYPEGPRRGRRPKMGGAATVTKVVAIPIQVQAIALKKVEVPVIPIKQQPFGKYAVDSRFDLPSFFASMKNNHHLTNHHIGKPPGYPLHSINAIESPPSDGVIHRQVHHHDPNTRTEITISSPWHGVKSSSPHISGNYAMNLDTMSSSHGSSLGSDGSSYASSIGGYSVVHKHIFPKSQDSTGNSIEALSGGNSYDDFDLMGKSYATKYSYPTGEEMRKLELQAYHDSSMEACSYCVENNYELEACKFCLPKTGDIGNHNTIKSGSSVEQQFTDPKMTSYESVHKSASGGHDLKDHHSLEYDLFKPSHDSHHFKTSDSNHFKSSDLFRESDSSLGQYTGHDLTSLDSLKGHFADPDFLNFEAVESQYGHDSNHDSGQGHGQTSFDTVKVSPTAGEYHFTDQDFAKSSPSDDIYSPCPDTSGENIDKAGSSVNHQQTNYAASNSDFSIDKQEMLAVSTSYYRR